MNENTDNGQAEPKKDSPPSGHEATGIPPKVEPVSLAMRQDAALEQADADSMPVLAAFQQFLEAERIRSRNRMITLSIAFATVLIVLMVAGTVVAVSMFRPVQREFLSLQDDIDSYQRQSERAAERIDRMLERFQDQDRRFRDQIAGERQAHAETKTELSLQKKQIEADLEHVQRLVQELRRGNMRLQRNIENVQNDTPEMLGEVPDALRGIDGVRGGGASRSTPPLPVIPAAPVSGPLVLNITPAGSDQALTWRLPWPE